MQLQVWKALARLVSGAGGGVGTRARGMEEGKQEENKGRLGCCSVQIRNLIELPYWVDIVISRVSPI